MWVHLLLRFYALLLCLYPRVFRAEFEAEMQTTFREMVAKAAERGTWPVLLVCLREARDLPLNLWWEHRAVLAERRRKMDTQERIESGNSANPRAGNGTPDSGDGGSWRHTLLAGSPFLLIALGGIFSTYLPYTAWQVAFGVVMLFVIYAALGVGWVQGFPRWSYPYIIPLPGVALLGVVAATITGELLNLSPTILFVVTATVAIGLTHSLQPLRQLVGKMWHDWTLLPFAVYGLTPVALSIFFDDAHYNNLTPFYGLAVVSIALGGLLYLHRVQAWQRMAALLGGVTLTAVMSLLDRVHFIGSAAYTYQDSGWIFTLWLLFVVLIVAPALLIGITRFSLDFFRSA